MEPQRHLPTPISPGVEQSAPALGYRYPAVSERQDEYYAAVRCNWK